MEDAHGEGPRRWRLAVVVVNYRTPGLVVDSLSHLVDQIEGGRDRVVVVDNHSEDGSPEAILAEVRRRGWSDRVEVARADRNGGFSAGNNVGIRALEADWYLLLNSDAYPRENGVRELFECIARRPDVELVSPRLTWPDGRPQESTFRFHRPPSELERAACTGPISRLLAPFVVARRVSDEPSPFEWASFACILVKRSVFERIGLLDEGYFMYFEDADFCRRAAVERIVTLHWPAAEFVHLRGGTSEVKQRRAAKARPPAYYYESRARYYKKFHGRFGLFLANACWTAGRALHGVRELATRKARVACEREWRDIWLGFRGARPAPESWRGAPL